MTDYDTRIVGNLRALADHLEAHPELAETATVRATRNELIVQVYPWHGGGHLDTLAAWARTLTPTGTVRITAAEDGASPHLEMLAEVADGNPVAMVCLPNPDETDLLAANLPLVKGAEFDVDVLHRLTDSAVTA